MGPDRGDVDAGVLAGGRDAGDGVVPVAVAGVAVAVAGAAGAAGAATAGAAAGDGAVAGAGAVAAEAAGTAVPVRSAA